MKTAPVQLLQLMFTRVKVEMDEQHVPTTPLDPLTDAFMFDGVKIETEFAYSDVESDHDRGALYMTSLRVLIDNAPPDDDRAQKFSPYLIDIEVAGVVQLLKSAEKLGPPHDLVAVNGASLLWSAVREQVLTLTARMPAGPVTLPTVNFHDLRRGDDKSEPLADAAKPPAARKRTTRKAKPDAP